MKNSEHISSENISVVVQGAVDPIYTPICLASIRRVLSKAELILSTWEGTQVKNLDFDKVVFNRDPGSFKMSPLEDNNVKRQIYSTIQGIKVATRLYVLKIRSDMELKNKNFLRYFDTLNDYDADWHFLEKRIIIPSMVSRDPRVWESPMCPSDWCSFGTRADMQRMWDIALPTSEEEEWFNFHEKPTIVKDIYPPLVARYNPEQFIWIGFVKKYVKEIHSQHMFDINELSINETLRSFANNLTILSQDQFGFNFLKPARKGSDRWHIITWKNFLQIYNQYSHGHARVPLIDFQRIKLFKYFIESNKRLYKRAKNENDIGDFLKRESKYISPLLYQIARPLIWWVKRKERHTKPELWWIVRPDKKPNFSIVIPVHGLFEYFSQAINSLKNQTYRDFEVVVTDDTPERKIRRKIKHLLKQFNTETNVDVKYIYTKSSLGQSRNVNQGLNHIRGSWVRILHPDDLLSPSVLLDEFKLIQGEPNVIALFHNVVDFQGDNTDYSRSDSSYRTATLSAEFIIRRALHTHCAIPSSMIFKANLLKVIGKYDPSLCRACDWDFWGRIVLYALRHKKKLLHIPDKNIFYRHHDKQNSRKMSTYFVNYNEYVQIAYKVGSTLQQVEGFPSLIIQLYMSQAFIYRKTRLVEDYCHLPWWARLLYFKRYSKLLRKGK